MGECGRTGDDDFDEIEHRAPAGCGGRGRGDLLRAGDPRSDRTADDQSRQLRRWRRRSILRRMRRGSAGSTWRCRTPSALAAPTPRWCWARSPADVALDCLERADTFRCGAWRSWPGLLAWGRGEFTGPGPLTEAVCVKVERGASLAQVSRQLEAQGAVSDARIFRIGADYADRAAQLKFGSYLVPPGASMGEVLEILTAGGQSTCGREVNFRIGVARSGRDPARAGPGDRRLCRGVRSSMPAGALPPEYTAAVAEGDLRWRVTLAEGVTSWQVVDSLRRAEFLTGEIAEVPPEGTLAPDSYEVERGADRAALLAEMAQRQSRILADLWAARADGLPYASPEEALDHGLDRGEGDRRSRGAPAGGERVPEPDGAGDAVADRPDGDLRDHQGRGRAGPRACARASCVARRRGTPM